MPKSPRKRWQKPRPTAPDALLPLIQILAQQAVDELLTERETDTERLNIGAASRDSRM